MSVTLRGLVALSFVVAAGTAAPVFASGTVSIVGRAPSLRVYASVGMKIGGRGRYAAAAAKANNERITAAKQLTRHLSARGSRSLRRLARRSRSALRLGRFERGFVLSRPKARPVIEESYAAEFLKRGNGPCYYQVNDGYIVVIALKRLPNKAMRARLTKWAKHLVSRGPFEYQLKKANAEDAAEMIYRDGFNKFSRSLKLLGRKHAVKVRVLMLHLAVADNNATVVGTLFRQRVAVNARNKDRYNATPLHVAAENGALTVARLLLKRGAKINATNEFDKTPLHDAISSSHTKVALYLIGKGANVNYMSQKYWSPLHAAAAAGDVAVVKALLAAKADPKAKKKNGRSVADVAKTAAVKKLLGL